MITAKDALALVHEAKVTARLIVLEKYITAAAALGGRTLYPATVTGDDFYEIQNQNDPMSIPEFTASQMIVVQKLESLGFSLSIDTQEYAKFNPTSPAASTYTMAHLFRIKW